MRGKNWGSAKNWGMGREGNLLKYIPTQLKFFDEVDFVVKNLKYRYKTYPILCETLNRSNNIKKE